MADNILEYKGRPLVRKDNGIYYGAPTDSCVVYMQILHSKDVNGTEVADKVQVMLMSTDKTLSMKERILKAGLKPSLYAALDVGYVWLESALHKQD